MQRFTIESYEDYYTFFHQSLLNIIQKLEIDKTSANKICYPNLMQQIHNQLMTPSPLVIKLESEGNFMILTSINPTGVAIDKEQIINTYNYPLLNHSAKITVIYKKRTQEASITCEIYGASGFDGKRFHKTSEQFIKEYTSFVYTTDQSVSFSFKFKNAKNLNKEMEQAYNCIVAAAAIISWPKHLKRLKNALPAKEPIKKKLTDPTQAQQQRAAPAASEAAASTVVVNKMAPLLTVQPKPQPQQQVQAAAKPVAPPPTKKDNPPQQQQPVPPKNSDVAPAQAPQQVQPEKTWVQKSADWAKANPGYAIAGGIGGAAALGTAIAAGVTNGFQGSGEQTPSTDDEEDDRSDPNSPNYDPDYVPGKK